MANTKSARKRAAKSAAQRDINRAARSRMRTAVKKARRTIAEGENASPEAVAAAISIVDSSARKGLVHKNLAARTKSRLAAAQKRAAK